VASAIPGASAIRICGDTGTPYPQYALARDGDRLWVSCRDRHWLQRVDAGNLTAQLGLGTHSPVSIAVAAGAVWTSDRSNSLTRIDTATGRRSSQPLESDSAYLWAAAGSIWVAEDSARTLARVDPASGQVRARIQTGDGTSAFVVDGRSAWMVNHRDGTLDRIDLATNALTHLGRLPGDAPERMVMLGGSLWVTGRGTDLLRVDPATGAVQAVVDMGAGAIDLAAAGGSIWVFAPTPDDDRQGLPIVERVLRVDPATNAVAQTVRTTGRVVLNGLVSDGSAVWLADTSGGRLYRLAG
jgi:streptogramin lyase